MPKLDIHLALDASARTTDADGRLHIHRTHISKAVVNPYFGREIPGYERLGLDPERVYNLLRHPDELARGAHTFARLPILIGHVPVSADDIKRDRIAGAIGSNVEFNEPYLDADVCIWDAGAIAGIESNEVREFSCSYRYVPLMTPGEWQGQSYDGIMTEIVGNHLALVEAGRAGSDVLAADAKTVDTREYKLSGSEEFLNRVEQMLAQIVHMGAVGHSGNIAFSVDGDGRDRLEIQPELKLKGEIVTKGSYPDQYEVVRFAADEDITMKMTKAGKALYLTLGGMSPKLAADSALAGLVGKASGKTTKVDELAPKIVAMDSALDAEKLKKTLVAVLALDAEKAEDEDEDEEEDDRAEDEEEDEDEERKKRAKDKAKDEDKKETEKAMDAKIADMRQSFRDADEAKRLVRPIVGDVVAQDTAEEIYGFALDQMKVNREGVTGTTALRALFNVANSAQPATPAVALDSASVATMFPDIARFGRR